MIDVALAIVVWVVVAVLLVSYWPSRDARAARREHRALRSMGRIDLRGRL